MNKGEAIEQLKLWLNYLYPDTDIYHAVAMAIDALEEYESLAKSLNDAVELIHKLQKKDEWIPCSERLLDDVSIAYENGYQQGKFEALSDIPDTNVGKWIPCSERLPKPDTKVLVQTNHGLITDGRWTGDTWFTTDDYTCYKVIAWMPLPEPYTEKRGD